MSSIWIYLLWFYLGGFISWIFVFNEAVTDEELDKKCIPRDQKPIVVLIASTFWFLIIIGAIEKLFTKEKKKDETN